MGRSGDRSVGRARGEAVNLWQPNPERVATVLFHLTRGRVNEFTADRSAMPWGFDANGAWSMLRLRGVLTFGDALTKRSFTSAFTACSCPRHEYAHMIPAHVSEVAYFAFCDPERLLAAETEVKRDFMRWNGGYSMPRIVWGFDDTRSLPELPRVAGADEFRIERYERNGTELLAFVTCPTQF